MVNGVTCEGGALRLDKQMLAWSDRYKFPRITSCLIYGRFWYANMSTGVSHERVVLIRLRWNGWFANLTTAGKTDRQQHRA